MNLNKVMLCGRITKEPELRTTPNGSSVMAFSLATNYVYKNKGGEKVESTDFHNVVAWGKMAELINQYCGKGDELFIEGRLTTRSWEKDGKKNYRTEVIATGMQFGQKKKGAEKKVQQQQEEQAPASNIENPEDLNVDDIPF